MLDAKSPAGSWSEITKGKKRKKTPYKPLNESIEQLSKTVKKEKAT